MRKTMLVYCLVLLAGIMSTVRADITVTIKETHEKSVGNPLGTVSLSASDYGTVFTIKIKGLSPGVHGFHVHQNPDCGPETKDGKSVPGLAAGGHYDPKKTGKHGAPWGTGHLGDLPALQATLNGTVRTAVLAPRIKLSDLRGRSLMIHARGDNYSDNPKPLGGGGARMACGVIK